MATANAYDYNGTGLYGSGAPGSAGGAIDRSVELERYGNVQQWYQQVLAAARAIDPNASLGGDPTGQTPVLSVGGRQIQLSGMGFTGSQQMGQSPAQWLQGQVKGPDYYGMAAADPYQPSNPGSNRIAIEEAAKGNMPQTYAAPAPYVAPPSYYQPPVAVDKNQPAPPVREQALTRTAPPATPSSASGGSWAGGLTTFPDGTQAPISPGSRVVSDPSRPTGYRIEYAPSTPYANADRGAYTPPPSSASGGANTGKVGGPGVTSGPLTTDPNAGSYAGARQMGYSSPASGGAYSQPDAAARSQYDAAKSSRYANTSNATRAAGSLQTYGGSGQFGYGPASQTGTSSMSAVAPGATTSTGDAASTKSRYLDSQNARRSYKVNSTNSQSF